MLHLSSPVAEIGLVVGAFVLGVLVVVLLFAAIAVRRAALRYLFLTEADAEGIAALLESREHD